MSYGCGLAFWAAGSPARLCPASVALAGAAAGTCAVGLRRAAGTSAATLRRAGLLWLAVGLAGHGLSALCAVLGRGHRDPGIFRRAWAWDPAWQRRVCRRPIP